MKNHRMLIFLIAAAMFAACNSEPPIEDQLNGSWKNGDGNIIRFADGAKAAVGQEGLSGEGECRFEVRQDTIVVTMLPDGPSDTYVIYRMRLENDTLRIASLERHAPNSVRTLTVEQYAQQAGRPLYKLA